jgi:lipoprotein-anchoring transpeptidase ErfK/SrfK
MADSSLNKDMENKHKRKSRLPGWFSGVMLLLGFFVFFHAGMTGVSAQDMAATDSPQTTTTPTPTLLPTPSQTPDKYFADYFAHSWDIPEDVSQGNTLWIEVNLTAQTLSVYRGGQIINTFLISSGTDWFKTVTGSYKIYAKYSQYTMRGPDYDLPDVPYSMFFYKGYSIHGTYWHHNFGTPMSRGCINMKTEEAAWVFENAPVGTYVFIHY